VKSPRFRRVAAAGAGAILTASAVVAGGFAPASSATPTYRATITRTEHDIPHIVADNWGSLGFGSSFGVGSAASGGDSTFGLVVGSSAGFVLEGA
jgi:hypothetical protein